MEEAHKGTLEQQLRWALRSEWDEEWPRRRGDEDMTSGEKRTAVRWSNGSSLLVFQQDAQPILRGRPGKPEASGAVENMTNTDKSVSAMPDEPESVTAILGSQQHH